MPHRSPTSSQFADLAAVLAQAVGRAAKILEISETELAQIISTSETTASNILSGIGQLRPDTREGELGALLVRLHLALDALIGNEDKKRLVWLNSHNRALNCVPRQIMLKAEGLCSVVAYLEGMRRTT